MYKVDFPTTEDLQRLPNFGLCRVSGTECLRAACSAAIAGIGRSVSTLSIMPLGL